MQRLDLIDFGWNNWNGFYLEILRIECGAVDSCLFQIALSDYLYIDILFFTFKIITPWGNDI